MAQSLRPYTSAISLALNKALCIQPFPSQVVERQNHPEIEVQSSYELVLPPVVVRRNEKEHCLIEPSINSVRISLKLHSADALEGALVRLLSRFLAQRADSLDVMRRVPVEGYDVSFLVTDAHVARLGRARLVDWVVRFVEEVEAEAAGLKLAVNARGRAVASHFLRTLAF